MAKKKSEDRLALEALMHEKGYYPHNSRKPGDFGDIFDNMDIYDLIECLEECVRKQEREWSDAD